MAQGRLPENLQVRWRSCPEEASSKKAKANKRRNTFTDEGQAEKYPPQSLVLLHFYL
jgi:hypothetical protein